MTDVPSSLVLDVNAEYSAAGDTVLAAIFVVDPSTNLGFPGLVKSGVCSLLYRTNVMQSVTFDKRFGNGPEGLGDFVVQFSHPSAISDLQVLVELDLHPFGLTSGPNNKLYKQVPVHAEGIEEFIPLQAQKDTSDTMNNELRSKKRIEEFL